MRYRSNGSQDFASNSKFICERGWRRLDLFCPALSGFSSKTKLDGLFVVAHIEVQAVRLDPDILECVERSAEPNVSAENKFLGFEKHFHFGSGVGNGAFADRLASHQRAPS